MNIDVLTKEDLQAFRMQLLNDIKELFSMDRNERKMKPWLRSKEVRKLLNISPGTLQSLRITEKISSTKIGNLYYYKLADIEKLLDNRGNGKI
jgi:Helix-turn-helix domain